MQIHRELPATTPVWSYRREHGTLVRYGSGRSYLGPTIEVRRGEAVTVAWKNEIDDSHRLPYEVIKTNADAIFPFTQNDPGRQNAIPEADDTLRVKLRGLRATLVTHLHGARVQADYDGWPDNTVIFGQSAHYTYHNDQAATMLWYHDHSMHVTRANVFAGLAGAWLIRDDEEASLDLPHGDHELPLVIQDRNLDLDAEGNFTGAMLHKAEVNDGVGPAEFFGPYTLVNGMIWPKADVEPRLYRLRILNGSNARTYRLLLLDDQGNIIHGAALWQIGCDQGLMQNKTRIPDSGLILAPAERADVLVDFSTYSGKKCYLWNTAEAPFGDRPEEEPDAAAVKAELLGLLADPFAVATPENRRPFAQVMRFDVGQRTHGPSDQVPADPLWRMAHTPLTIDESTTVRIMGLVEKDHDAPLPPDATTMLVFYEFVRVSDEPAPEGTPVVQITYFHPGKNANITEPFWKGAEGFYDQTNWFVHLNSTEVWYIANLSGDTHPVHVHLVDFQVLNRFRFFWNNTDHTAPFNPADSTLESIDPQGELPIEENVEGPKDTVRVNPGEMVGIAMKFSPYPGRYIYHCHILEHEDHDMMRSFVVVPKWVPHHDH
ncbi:multicopper oxidase family protein [Tundrisphaera lichenicola]|uniref:multicopper oxidase family protein n=1 Tax=Tundrisphaera lichenicola TaxID=2029860 RepID=UPI003EB8A15A